ncbi:MAG: hypothetical protein JWM80_4190 [Cyanobacteria bacterium RYN_339]|nr:hypothetical protein [Cyanobacteria bacterium RYN_339]
MGFHWHLAPYIAGRGVTWEQLDERLGFTVPGNMRGVIPPFDLSMSVVADLCQALGCQPGDLLTFSPDSAAEQAERQLAGNQSYQSFLNFHEGKKKKP